MLSASLLRKTIIYLNNSANTLPCKVHRYMPLYMRIPHIEYSSYLHIAAVPVCGSAFWAPGNLYTNF